MTDLNAIIAREASDSFKAFQTANAMQGLPFVDVISIVCHPAGKLLPHDTGERWHVFAKFAPDVIDVNRIDESIEKALCGGNQ